jgi:hypothetical protein
MKKTLCLLIGTFIIGLVVLIVLPRHTGTPLSNSSQSIPDQPKKSVEDSAERIFLATYGTSTDEKSDIMFSYPLTLPYRFVSFTEWPPRFINSLYPTNCVDDEQTIAMSGVTHQLETINSTEYCLGERREGAAGSIYKTYEASYPKDGQYFTMSFTLQYVNCQNFPIETATTCEDEQASFPLNALIDDIAQSATLPR